MAPFLALWLPSAMGAELKSWLGSAFAVPGEESELWLSVISETRPAELPEIPQAENVTFKLLGDPVYPRSTRERLYVYKYSVLSYQEGSHVIPSFELTVSGVTLQSQPLRFHVSALSEEAWFEQAVAGESHPFATRICLPKAQCFEGETLPAEVKAYIPARLKLKSAAIAELDHDGVVAPRFEISTLLYPRNVPFITNVRLNGEDYFGVAYRSTATAIHPGAVSLGPGRARLTVEARISTRGFFEDVPVPLTLPVQGLEFNAQPLPQPAPDGFRNAVGKFTLAALADTKGLREGDTISVRLMVVGRGNLDSLEPPELLNTASHWKIYPAQRLEREGQRRDISGMAAFTQIIRPLQSQDAIPPFRLIAFDPETKQYETISTPPIPFTVTPAANALQPSSSILPDLNTPTEDMQSILGLVDPARGRSGPATKSFPGGHLIPGLLAIALVIQIIRTRFLPRWRRPEITRQLEQDLRVLEESAPDARSFFRASGSFIENWIPQQARDEEVQAVLDRRDLDCFRPPNEQVALADEERQSIVELLRTRGLSALSVLVASFICLLGTPLDAAPDPTPAYRQAEAAWDEGAFRTAMHLYEAAHEGGKLPPDVLYNIGNCYFQLGEHGMASLYYQRALHRDPAHPEARQNLRFLKRKTGAITIERPNYQEQLAKLGLALFTSITSGGIWLATLATLGLFAFRGMRVILWSTAAVGSIFALAGGVCLLLYPNDLEFAPIEEQAVMINAETVPARTEATNSGAEVIPVPPGSLCRPLATRGRWTYVELPNDLRGWLPTELLRPISPEQPAGTSDPAPQNA